MIGSNNDNGFDFTPVSRAELDGQIIEKTLDALNSPSSGGTSNSGSKPSTSDAISSSYNFNKDVLSAAYSTKGALVNNGT